MKNCAEKRRKQKTVASTKAPQKMAARKRHTHTHTHSNKITATVESSSDVAAGVAIYLIMPNKRQTKSETKRKVK